MTALMGACAGGHLPVVKELVENRGANVNATDNVRYYIQIRFMMDRCEVSSYTY
jgi:ankyrin repeat protein